MVAKRHLNQRQHQRIKAMQAERSSAPELTGLIIAHFGKYVDVLTEDKQTYRCNLRQNLEPLVVGDQVVFQMVQEQRGVVGALLSRQNLLWRREDTGQTKLLAANIDQIIIVVAPEPEPTPLLLDSYLVAAEYTAAKPIIVLNKIDLMTDAHINPAAILLQNYTGLGYQTILANTLTADGLTELQLTLQGHTSIFVGQSGVGKSSIIQHLLPDETLGIGEISAKTGHGCHTTTTARLYHLPCGGKLIDSPGIREFKLGQMQASEIAQGFTELHDYLGQCKFNDCSHSHEPGCAILKAVEAGAISAARLESYYALVQTAK